MEGPQGRMALLVAAVLGAAGLVTGFIVPSPAGDVLRLVLFAGALALVIWSLVARRRAGRRNSR